MNEKKLTQAERIKAMNRLIEKQAGKAVRPYRQDGYVNLLNRYGTSKDATEHYHFEKEPTVPDDTLTSFYEGNGLFAKIIDTPAEEAVKHGFTLDDVSDQQVVDFYEESLDELDWEETAMTALKWMRLFGGSIVVMLINDGRGIDEPLDWKNIKSIDDLRIYDRSIITPDRQSMFSHSNDDPFRTRGSRLGKPEYYMVNSRYGSFTVHESRCLVFSNGTLPENTTNSEYELWGMPEYIRLNRAIRDAVLAHRCAPKMLDRSVQAVYKMRGLAQELATEQGESMVLRRLQTIDLARGMLNSITIDSEGEDYDFRQFQFSGVGEAIDATCNFLSALTSIPQTILFGRSPAGMNSTGEADMENYYNFVERIQKRCLKTNLRYLLSVLFQAGVATGEVDEVPKIKLKFNSLWSVSENEQADIDLKKAQIQQTKATTAQTYVNLQVLDPSEIRKELSSSDEFDIENILDDEDSDDELFEGMNGNESDPEEGNSSESAPAATKLPQDMTDEDLAQKAVEGDKNVDSDEQEIGGVGVIVVSDGKILCGTRHNDFGYGLICGPGGHVEKGETPEQAALRETEEEFGIKPLELIPLGTGPKEPDTGLTPMVFLCTEFRGEPECIDLEMVNPQFRTLEEIEKLSSLLFQPFSDGLKLMLNCLDDSVDEDGGPGSGNHNHGGVPGQIGGSAPGPFDSSSVDITYSRGAQAFSKKTQDKLLSLCGARAINPSKGNADIEIVKKGFGDKEKAIVAIESNGVQCQIDVDVDNKYIDINHLNVSDKGKGKGTKVMTDIITEAKTQGFPKVELKAVGSKDGDENGYYTWARLGFDGDLSKEQKEKAESAGFKASRVSDLMATDEGRSWWKENGSTIHLEFDLTDESESLKTLSNYLNSRNDEDIEKGVILKDGGPGSGNHGHEGVPGEVGGSMPSGKEMTDRVKKAYKSSDYTDVGRAVRKELKDSPVGTKVTVKNTMYTKIGDGEWEYDFRGKPAKAVENAIANNVSAFDIETAPVFETPTPKDVAEAKVKSGELDPDETDVKVSRLVDLKESPVGSLVRTKDGVWEKYNDGTDDVYINPASGEMKTID